MCSAWLTLQAFGGDMSHEEIEELFHGAGENSRGCVSTDSLANSLQQYQLQGGLFKIIKRYAVCWAPHPSCQSVSHSIFHGCMCCSSINAYHVQHNKQQNTVA